MLVSVGTEQRNDNFVVLFQFFLSLCVLCLTGYDSFLSSQTDQITEALFVCYFNRKANWKYFENCMSKFANTPTCPRCSHGGLTFPLVHTTVCE